ncbi:hypothetical protein [Pyxidicoccus xibeiensis]|uniref:hypothetical protein n=1 Tax=Pyxidicoccus xibeiensis TaxID=2906759 RepID=UPI0020A70500|nr:hypothetical protein [Pyxidicoccus xibeiensis]MCP3136917.1 hypothetical protein [Pyxidicoccus xibeiensis]
MLTLSLTSGCPTAHRRDGTLDRAMRKDIKEGLDTGNCDQSLYEEHCRGKEDSEECLSWCFE